MKTQLLAMALLLEGTMFAETRVPTGIGFGGYGVDSYQPPPSYASNIPACPGPGYTWVDGYWSQDYGRKTWIAGYWYRPPFSSGYRVAPRFDNPSHDGDDRHGFTRSSEQNRNQGFDQGRKFKQQDQNWIQARGNRDRSSDRDNRQRSGYVSGFRGR